MKIKFISLLSIAIIAAIVFFVSCTSPSSPIIIEKPKTPEELRAELKNDEQVAPQKYLSINAATIRENITRPAGLFNRSQSDGYLIQGEIRNSASIARFKDIILKVQYLSPTQSIIQENDYVVYEFFEPSSSKTVTFKVYPPDAMKGFSVSVKSATPVD